MCRSHAGDTCTTFTDHRCLTVAEEDPIYGNRAINSIRKWKMTSDVAATSNHCRRIVKLTTQKNTQTCSGFGPGIGRFF